MMRYLGRRPTAVPAPTPVLPDPSVPLWHDPANDYLPAALADPMYQATSSPLVAAFVSAARTRGLPAGYIDGGYGCDSAVAILPGGTVAVITDPAAMDLWPLDLLAAGSDPLDLDGRFPAPRARISLHASMSPVAVLNVALALA